MRIRGTFSGPFLEQTGARGKRGVHGAALGVALGLHRSRPGRRAPATEAEGDATRSTTQSRCRAGRGSGAVHGAGDAALRGVNSAAHHHLAALPNPLHHLVSPSRAELLVQGALGRAPDRSRRSCLLSDRHAGARNFARALRPVDPGTPRERVHLAAAAFEHVVERGGEAGQSTRGHAVTYRAAAATCRQRRIAQSIIETRLSRAPGRYAIARRAPSRRRKPATRRCGPRSSPCARRPMSVTACATGCRLVHAIIAAGRRS